MPSPDLVADVDRQFAICNACRYCEGFCAVFPAAERRRTFAAADVAYLANLCHDCRMCYDACPFTPPHDYAINIPALLARGRVETYREYGAPATLARLVATPLRGTSAIALAALAAVFAAALSTTGAGVLLAPHVGPGAFYRIFSFASLVTAALALTVLGAAVVAAGALRFARDVGLRVAPRDLGRAARDALTLVYLRGGGAGCYDEHRGSSTRRTLHAFVFWGFLAAFASTVSAGIAQDVLGIVPPFALLSVPVVLGVAGGAGIAIGSLGFLVLKRRSDRAPEARSMLALDDAFLLLLAAVALTGLALLAFRGTAAMGTLLAVHLAALLTLYVTAPYGKFVHAVYRYVALVKHAAETADAS